MKRIIIIGEGPTEQIFCNDVLQAVFNAHDIFLETPKIKKSKGGIVAWEHLKKQVELHLKDTEAYVTTLIDYYGIHSRHAFPKTTSPSKRLNRIIGDYSKVVYGSLLAQEIGLDKIRERCPRFNNWIERLLAIE